MYVVRSVVGWTLGACTRPRGSADGTDLCGCEHIYAAESKGERALAGWHKTSVTRNRA